MSRSGYCDDWGENQQITMINWRGAVLSALRGKRGQKFLRELLAAMDSMEEKQLEAEELVTPTGACCTLGVVAKARGIDVSEIDPQDSRRVGEVLGIANAMVCEVVYMNDEAAWGGETGHARFQRMRAWVVSNIIEE